MGEAHYYAKVMWSGGALGPTKSVENYSREFRAESESRLEKLRGGGKSE